MRQLKMAKSSESDDTNPREEMSIKIGNRVVTPALPVVDSSYPSLSDIEFNRILSSYVSSEVLLESKSGIQKRERVLNELSIICREWIKSVCKRLELPEDIIAGAGGELFTSGSYRLGVHEPGADIDTIVVAPRMCSREDFFGRSNLNIDQDRDPDSLAERTRKHPAVTNFTSVEGATVPILKFEWEGVDIDLLFARINTVSVPPNFDIDDDGVLDGVDSATEKSLNGPRVTNLIAALVGGNDTRYQSFLSVVRCIRKWAKARGIYSNKLGYWGGVNINIAVALVVQLYPNACPASLLRKFFLLYKSWRWPNPVMLTKPHDAHLGLPIWSAYSALTLRQVAPIITPAYPSMNSSLSISRQTLQILHEEICRAHDIIALIWKRVKQGNGNDDDILSLFHELFEPSDFFISYPYYLSLSIVGSSQHDLLSWLGFVESRLRKLVSDMLGKSLPLSKIQLWPKNFEACCADSAALLNHSQRVNSMVYFIGFQIDTFRMRGNQLNIEQQIQKFRDYELTKFQPLNNGMDLFVRSYKVNELPEFVFDDVYKGGKKEALKKRKIIRNSDPKRIEAKKLAKLKELKAKMAQIQSKKKEAKDMKQEDDTEVPKLGNVNQELNETEEFPKTQEDEADQLETALDNIQSTSAAVFGGTSKTREEAEQDRRKLLAGELLIEGGGIDDEEDDTIINTAVNVKKENPIPSSKIQKNQFMQLEIEELRRAGYNIVSEDEVISFAIPAPKRRRRPIHHPKIVFKTKFDIVKLDDFGNVIDKGDDDFMPCKKWIGRKPGFEFKTSLRGLGYYRTGKKVIVPSNIAY